MKLKRKKSRLFCFHLKLFEKEIKTNNSPMKKEDTLPKDTDLGDLCSSKIFYSDRCVRRNESGRTKGIGRFYWPQ